MFFDYKGCRKITKMKFFDLPVFIFMFFGYKGCQESTNIKFSNFIKVPDQTVQLLLLFFCRKKTKYKF